MTPICPYEFKITQGSPRRDPTIERLLETEDLAHLTQLQNNLFDPSLWSQLTEEGSIRHHHLLIAQEFTPGHLWAQPTLEGSAIHWGDAEDKTIYRATLFEGKVFIDSFQIKHGKGRTIRISITGDQFKKLIHDYLQEFSPIKKSIALQDRPDWLAFQRQLELLRIVVNISTAAAKQFLEWQSDYPRRADFSTAIFFEDPRSKNEQTAFIDVSGKFIVERLSVLEKKADVAPAIRSWEAYAKINTLNHPTVDPSQLKASHFDCERKVADLSNRNTPFNLRWDQLQPTLILRFEDEIEVRSFQVVKTQRTTRADQFALSIDYKNDKWDLKYTASHGNLKSRT